MIPASGTLPAFAVDLISWSSHASDLWLPPLEVPGVIGRRRNWLARRQLTVSGEIAS